jgi:hypothetical protein
VLYRNLDGSEQELKRLAAKLLAFHPLASIFPHMGGKEFDALAADIAAKGLREKITLYEDKILDGVNRYRACLKAGVEPQFETFEGDAAAAIAFVISKNICRRHLKPRVKRDLAAKLLRADPGRSDRSIAEQLQMSPTTIGDVRREKSTVQPGQLPPKRIGKDGKARKQLSRRSSNGDHPSHRRRAGDGDHRGDRGRDAGAARDDIGPNSVGERQRLQSEIDGLHDRLHRQTTQIAGLESEIDELKTATPVAGNDPGPIPDFLRRDGDELQRLQAENRDLKAKIAELETAAAKPLTEILAAATASQLVDALEVRLCHDGINVAPQLQKIRSRIEECKLQIDLQALPALGSA